ncbi:uncharacterized protein LOC134679600 [Cydia fagiglandana]|uniref:uncharacterized protein LOC134679600 n=1 Tax=Cydia fagiglandana TaxID=1458189 RepID=UPI002FEE45CA
MAMEPTVFFIALIVIANIKNCVSVETNSARGKSPIENFNEMMEQLIARTEGNHTPAPNGETVMNQNQKQKHAQEPSTERQKWQVLTTTAVPNTDSADASVNSTENDLNNKNSKIIYVNNFPSNKSLEHARDGKIDSENKTPLPFFGHDDHNILEYLRDSTNLKPSFKDNENMYERTEPQYNLESLEDSNKLPWFNYKDSKERFEDLPPRRSLSHNVPIPPTIHNPTDNGLGVVLKEEIVFEIEDEKPPESPNPPVKIRMHTTTPKPKPKIKGKNMTITYLPFFSGLRNISGNITDKPKINRLTHMKTQPSKGRPPIAGAIINKNQFDIPPQLLRHAEDNLQLQTEFKKLNDKINKLQEILNKTLDKKDEPTSRTLQVSNKDPKLPELPDKPHTEADVLRTGGSDVGHPNLAKTLTNPRAISVSRSTTPLILNSNQGMVENEILRKNILPPLPPILLNEAPLTEPKMLQRRLLLLKLANIAKLNRHVHMLSKMRKKSKYKIHPVPVYRRRVILKPLARIP